MRRYTLPLVAAAIMLAATCARAQEQHSLGLNFATPEQLAGIPLASTPFSGDDLPVSADLSTDLPPPGQQGQQSSCVGWATAYAMKSLQEREEEHWDLSQGDQPIPDRVFSPAFIYNQINNGKDGGSLIIDALNLLADKGAASLASMPYSERDFTARPSQVAVDAAKRYRIDYWRKVNIQDVREVKAQLHAGYPVVIGAMVDEGFMRQRPGEVWAQAGGKELGGHALLVVGYDDGKNAFKIINSWGREWGDAGYGWIGYDQFRRVVREGFVTKDASNGPGPGPNPPPTPPPPDARNYSLGITNVQHNVRYGFGEFDFQMCVNGNVRIQGAQNSNAQVVIRFFHNSGNGGKGPPVKANFPQFATPQGEAATGTMVVPIVSPDYQTTWWACMPYPGLQVPSGTMNYQPPITTALLMEPQLFIDNFGVTTASVVPFTVTW